MNPEMSSNGKDKLIITAASKSYGPSLLALLGSLNLNWPQHPPVLVYDIGLDEKTLSVLRKHDITVKKVPPFCPHWRKHFTWKIWCWNDAPARDILWMDAGLVVLQSVDEIFYAIEKQDYFVVSTGNLLLENASEAACRGCGVKPDFRTGKMTLATGLIGFCKQGFMFNIIQEAFNVALNEENVTATEPMHRHEQGIMSLLMFKHFGDVAIEDNNVYLGWVSPDHKEGQKIWVHRRSIRDEDLNHFITHISAPGKPYLPQNPSSWRSKVPLSLLRWWLGRFHKGFIYDGVRD